MSRTRRSPHNPWPRWDKPGKGRFFKRLYWKAVRRGDERAALRHGSELNRKGH